ncbi:MAG: hypothetical protein ACK4SF_19530 [Algoriphagus aquaeductus]|uniref:hypothetical protein n=1 Tax=Algoriphagus aquaeductus TaxID=475299 RepID=UPI00391B3D3C
MLRFILLSIFALGFHFLLKAQTEEKKIDILPEVHFRTFWMNTSYSDAEFKSDYALGMSLNLGAKINYANDWSFHLGYRSFANVRSSDIWSPDPGTGQANRYEIGLFDVLDPRDRFFGKWETFSLSYSKDRYGIKAGRMGINTDWVNAQDGRLSPTAVEGVHAWFLPVNNWKIGFWAIGRMSVRGSSEWLRVGETVGLYPQGRNVTGNPGNYFGNTDSKWLSIVEVDREFSKGSKLHFSHTLAQNLFSTTWGAFEKSKKLNQGTLNLGVQSGIQHTVGEGGNSDLSLAYKAQGDLNYALSGRIGWRNGRWITHLNYTHVGGRGRWLSPREWGKDAWYTFMPRERNEGYESVNALVGYVAYRLEKIPLQLYAHGGIHRLSEVADASANKYNFPSYRQLNVGLIYQPEKVKNLDVHLLLVSKEPLSSEKLTPNQTYNKVELLHLNGIVNWRWNK